MFSHPGVRLVRHLLLMGGCAALSACASLSGGQPLVTDHGVAGGSPMVPALTWQLDDLRPDESAVLIDGKTVPFSIEFKLHGPINNLSEFQIRFSTSHRRFHPFVVKTTGSEGELAFESTITWFSPVSGITDSARVALYRVQRSQSGKTVAKTLLAEIRRTYGLACDPGRFFLTGAIRRWLGLCRGS